MSKVTRGELARQIVVGLAAGAASSYAGPAAGALASGAAPAVLAGMDYISATIGARRLEHATETLTDAADESGAETPEEFIEFVKTALRDDEHQELLTRALTIAQDTAMRDKRRARSAESWRPRPPMPAPKSTTRCSSYAYSPTWTRRT